MALAMPMSWVRFSEKAWTDEMVYKGNVWVYKQNGCINILFFCPHPPCYGQLLQYSFFFFCHVLLKYDRGFWILTGQTTYVQCQETSLSPKLQCHHQRGMEHMKYLTDYPESWHWMTHICTQYSNILFATTVQYLVWFDFLSMFYFSYIQNVFAPLLQKSPFLLFFNKPTTVINVFIYLQIPFHMIHISAAKSYSVSTYFIITFPLLIFLVLLTSVV